MVARVFFPWTRADQAGEAFIRLGRSHDVEVYETSALHRSRCSMYSTYLTAARDLLGPDRVALTPSRDVPRCYYRCMADAEAWRRLHELAGRQFGLFTAAQARGHGVPRYELARRAAAGELFRAHRGVYGFTEDTAEMFLYEDWAAQWLALRPDADIDQRRATPDCIISHDSAAVIRELGDIVAYGLFLTGPSRINVRSARVRTYRRDIGARGVDWDIVEGLPVATAGRIIADLARDHLDGSHQGSVIADTVNSGLLTAEQVGERLDPFASWWDEPDGVALAQRFADAAGRRLRLSA